jgi:hypothetical protein
MILGAVVLGCAMCAIAGVSAIVLATIAPQEPPARVIAGVEKTGVSPLASGPIESRSASIYQRKRKSCIVVRVVAHTP